MLLSVSTTVLVLVSVIVTLFVTLLFVFDKLQTSKIKTRVATSIYLLSYGLALIGLLYAGKTYRMSQLEPVFKEESFREYLEKEAVVDLDTIYFESY